MSILPSLGGFQDEQVGRPDLDLEALNVLLRKADFSLEQEGATERPWIEGYNPFNVTGSGCSLEGGLEGAGPGLGG